MDETKKTTRPRGRPFSKKPKEFVSNLTPAEDTTETLDSQHENTTLETIDFTSGKNKLSIHLKRTKNRVLRVQIFLNDTLEVRPVSYTGSSSGYSFWNLLKNALIK